MTKLFLITHPDVVIDPKQKIDEWVISEKGIKRAKDLMDNPLWGEVAVIYSSTEQKAKTIAEMAKHKFSLPLFEKEGLVEIDRSSTGFMPFDEFMDTVKEFFKKPDQSCKGWETANAAMSRVSLCIESIMKKHSGENVVLIGHGAAFALLLSDIKGIKPTFDLCQDGVGFVSEIDWDKREIISMWKAY
jgi:broad specificity phosphatase PhoE